MKKSDRYAISMQLEVIRVAVDNEVDDRRRERQAAGSGPGAKATESPSDRFAGESL